MSMPHLRVKPQARRRPDGSGSAVNFDLHLEQRPAAGARSFDEPDARVPRTPRHPRRPARLTPESGGARTRHRGTTISSTQGCAACTAVTAGAEEHRRMDPHAAVPAQARPPARPSPLLRIPASRARTLPSHRRRRRARPGDAVLSWRTPPSSPAGPHIVCHRRRPPLRQGHPCRRRRRPDDQHVDDRARGTSSARPVSTSSVPVSRSSPGQTPDPIRIHTSVERRTVTPRHPGGNPPNEPENGGRATPHPVTFTAASAAVGDSHQRTARPAPPRTGPACPGRRAVQVQASTERPRSPRRSG